MNQASEPARSAWRKDAWRKNAMRVFRHDQRGAVALLFGLSFIPVLGITAAAVDYGRATTTRARLQGALDAAVLVSARDGANMTDTQLTARARAFVLANMTGNVAAFTLDTLALARTGKAVTLTGSATIPTAVMSVLGVNTITVGGLAKSVWGDNDIEIALVLDNTGSMASSNKLTELKRALCGDPACANTSPSTGFMKIMKDAANGADRIKVGIVPFDTTVRMPQAIQNTVNTGSPVSTSFYAPASAGYCTNGAITDDAIRISWFRFANRDKDTMAGNRIGGTMVGAGCGTNGMSRAAPASWEGCVWDRDTASSRDTTDGNLDMGDTSSLHPAVNCRTTALARLRPLADIWTESGAMISHLATMSPSGNTNLTVGVSWGQAILTSQAPFTEASPPATPSLYRVMILLTDGDNTENRSSTNQNQIDDRTRAACTAAKSLGITIYSVRVIDGDRDLLRECATNPGNYFEVANASQLTPVFQTIANQIGSIRITN